MVGPVYSSGISAGEQRKDGMNVFHQFFGNIPILISPWRKRTPSSRLCE